MRLAISNIAWDISEDENIARLLNHYDVDAIDIAPSKYFPNPTASTDEEITRVKRWWAERGIEITGMQALLHGTSGFNIFSSPEVQEKLLQYLSAVCRIGAGLGAKRLVFGSPKNRDRSGLSDQKSLDVAVPFFRSLGNIAEEYGVLICLEPNPAIYGANFMTNSFDTARVVNLISHPAIKMQLDTGALTINKEDPHEVLNEHAFIVGHVHASEPDLLPLGEGETDHENINRAVDMFLPDSVVSIEMLVPENVSVERTIKSALEVAIQYYRNPISGGRE